MAEKTEKSTPQRDAVLDERTFKSRTILLFGQINDTVGYNVVKQLVALSDESSAPINFLICSPGGHVESGDVIRFISAPVNMIGSGWVGSAVVNVFLSMPKERRFCLINTHFLIHQPSFYTAPLLARYAGCGRCLIAYALNNQRPTVADCDPNHCPM